MKILQVITGIQKAAGTSVFCGEVCNGLVAAGHSVTIAVANPVAKGVYPLDPRLQLVGIQSLEVQEQVFNVVHIHALWSPALHRISKWAHRNGMPVVWSPHGMLQKWALKNKCWKKFMALALYQWHDLRAADLLHATADVEVLDIRRIGLKNRVMVVPLGVRVNDSSSGIVSSIVGSADLKTLLFVSRVQRKKGLPVLIDAWAKVPKRVKKDWRVRIVGPDQDNHTLELKEQCRRLGVAGDFTFVGPKYDEELDKEYRSADLFVLPTHSENFGSVVIEALARSVPVICSQGAPWRELEECNCGWWVEDSVNALADTLQKVMSLSQEDRRAMGVRGCELVKRKYTWDAVVTALIDGYKQIA